MYPINPVSDIHAFIRSTKEPDGYGSNGWFSKLFNIYADEPEKTFDILQVIFSRFIRLNKESVHYTSVAHISLKINEESKISHRKALMDETKNLSMEIYCIAWKFPELFFPVEEKRDYGSDSTDPHSFSVEDVIFVKADHQDECVAFQREMREKLFSELKSAVRREGLLASVTDISEDEDLLDLWQEDGGNISDDVVKVVVQHAALTKDEKLEIQAKRKDFLLSKRMQVLLLEGNSDNISKEILMKVAEGGYVDKERKMAQKKLSSLDPSSDTPFGKPRGAVLTFMGAMLEGSGFSKKMPDNFFDSKAVVSDVLGFYCLKKPRI